MKDVSTEVARLRFMAAIQDKVAEGRTQNGISSQTALAEAKRLRVKADLLEQGVPLKLEY